MKRISLLAVILFSACLATAETVQRFPQYAPAYGAQLPSYVPGFLVDYKSLPQHSGEAWVRILDTQSGEWRTINIWPSDEQCQAVAILGLARLTDGRTVVGLRLISQSNQRLNALAVFGSDGKRESWFRTYPFAWDEMAVDREGKVWIFGTCPDYLEKECAPLSTTLRRYELTGKLLEEHLPLTAFPSSALNQAPSPEGNRWMGVIDDAVFVFVSQTREMVRVSRSDGSIKRQVLQIPENTRHIRFAISPSGRILTGANGWSALREVDLATGELAVLADHSGWLYAIEGGEVVTGQFVIGKETVLVRRTLE